MPIVNIKTDSAGEIGRSASPRIVKLITTDSLSEITTSGYMDDSIKGGFPLYPSDVITCLYDFNRETEAGTLGYFYVRFSGNGPNRVSTLDIWENPGNVELPVTDGHFAMFSGTEGQIKDDGFVPTDSSFKNVSTVDTTIAPVVNYITTFADTQGTIRNTTSTAIHPGDIQAGLDGTAAQFISYPGTSSTGRLILQAQDNSGNFSIAIKNQSHGQSTNYFLNDTQSAQSSILVTGIEEADANANLVWVTATATSAALAGGGQVAFISAPTGTAQYKIREMIYNAGGTSFSGGGGDRSLDITDGTGPFTGISDTNLQALSSVNVRWGETFMPFTTLAFDTPSNAGTDIFMQYAGGTADYTAGSITISLLYEKVAS